MHLWYLAASQMWMVCQVQHRAGGVTANQTCAFKVSISAWLHQQHSRERYHVVSAEITPTSLRRMPLAVLGGKQSGMEGGRRGRWRCGGRGVAVRGGGVVAGLQRLQIFVFLSHLWQGAGKVGCHRSKEWAQWGALAGSWRSRNQRCDVSGSLHHSMLFGLHRHRDIEMNNMKLQTRKKEETVNTFLDQGWIKCFWNTVFLFQTVQ